MKSWFAKFRISAALDDGKPLSSSLRRKIARSTELRHFAENSAALDRALKQKPASPEPPPSLQSSILRSVRATGRPAPRRNRSMLRWLPAPALAVLALLGLWWGLQRSPQPTSGQAMQTDPQPLAPVIAALDLSEDMTRTMPDAVMAPLAEEWQRLGRDLDHTAQFLRASLP